MENKKMENLKNGDIPKEGWVCENVIDRKYTLNLMQGIKYDSCEMCGNTKLRYVHIMKHPDYPNTLGVDCECAEKMSNDYTNPKLKEEALRKKFYRRNNFVYEFWNISKDKKTYTKKHRGVVITMKEAEDGKWGVLWDDQEMWEYNGFAIDSYDNAENVAFEVIEKLAPSKRQNDKNKTQRITT